MSVKTDKFANKFYGKVVESAANTLTFAEIPTNVDVFAKKAWILHRLEWYFAAVAISAIDAADDVIQAILTSSDKMTAVGLDNASIIDLFEVCQSFNDATSFQLWVNPIIRDFTSLPGGGLIIAPRPLYIGVKGTSMAAALTAHVRGYFTAVDLNADEYLELVDFYRIVQ